MVLCASGKPRVNWEAIGALAELGGAIGVIATLVYLSIQIRQNTRSVRLASFQSATDALNSINTTIGSSTELAELFGTVFDPEYPVKSMNELDAASRARFSFITLSLFRSWETAYYQRQEGLTLQQSWERYEVSLENQLKFEIVRDWWRNRGFGFTKDFAAYVDRVASKCDVDT